MRDSQLFEPLGKNAEYSTGALLQGTAQPRVHTWSSSGERTTTLGPAIPSSVEWFGSTTDAVQREAKAAARKAGISGAAIKEAVQLHNRGDIGAVEALLKTAGDAGAASRLRKLIACETMSHAEFAPPRAGERTKPATMTKPLAEAEWVAHVDAEGGGVAGSRVSRRHVVQRGVKADKVTPKLRCIDDLRRSGLHGTVSTHERVDLPSFLWILYAARAIVLAWCKQQRRLGVRGVISTFPRITCGLDDQAMAYRSILAHLLPFPLWVVYWSYRLGCCVIHHAYGMLFGAKAANINYSRVPRAACSVASIQMLVPCTHYVDDLINCDLGSGGQSAQRCIRGVLQSWGLDVEMLKRLANAPANIALGGRIDLAGVPTSGVAAAEPAKDKIVALLEQLRACEQAGECPAAEAENIANKCRWMVQQHRMHFGAACLQPFQQRARGRDASNAWSPAMASARSYLEIAFSDEFKQRLELFCGEAAAEPDDDIVLLFTDCAEDDADEPHPDGTAARRVDRVCFHAFDTRTGLHHSGHSEIPADYMARHFKVRKTYIGVGEEIAAVGAFYSAPELFRDRKVIHFVDNAGSLSHMVNGYAGQPDSACIVNMFHTAAAALGMRWWGEWIPSKANIADIMTRPERFYELRRGLGEDAKIVIWEFKLPPLDDSPEAMLGWMRSMRAAGEQ